jgi:hypothetical protein
MRLCARCHLPGHATAACPNGLASRLCIECRGRADTGRGPRCQACVAGGKQWRVTCGWCGVAGHNLRTCVDAIANPERCREDYEAAR